MSQQGGVYFEQGSGDLKVPSGASAAVESGGSIDIESGGSLKIGGVAVGASAAEIDAAADASSFTQTIEAAGAISLTSRHVKITGPSASTYAVTLAAPTVGGIVKVIEMVATTSTNSVTLALTNVVGGSAASTATFDAAGEILTLVSAGSKWVVLDELGVTLS